MARLISIVPRSAYPLLLLLLLAVAWLRWPRGGDMDRRIFRIDPGDVTALEIQLDDPHPRLLTILRRGEDGWSLDGTLQDLLDQESVDGLVASICAANRSPDVGIADWRRRAAEYGLQAPPVRISLSPAGAASRTLSIGGRNPSTGVYYAAFEGSDELFLVKPELADIAETVLGSVRATELWPGLTTARIDTLTTSPGIREAADVFVKDSRGRWWLLPPTDGGARFGPRQRAYQNLYADRRRAGDGAVRAKDSRVQDYLYLLLHSPVKSFLPLERTPPSGADAYRLRVAAAGGASHSLILDLSDRSDDLSAWRDGCRAGMRISAKALKYVDMPLSGLLHTDAITGSVAWSDSLSLRGPDAAELRARRPQDTWILAVDPPADQYLNDVLGDLIVFLDNLEILQTLPPRRTPGFTPGTVYVLTLWRSAADRPREEIRIGKLEGEGGTALWCAADGRLVVVPDGAYTFCREYFVMTRRALAERDAS